jgi:parallel beta-helix repeat protein
MKREVWNLALLVALPISLAGGVPARAAPRETKINKCPFTITASGAYVLQKNLNCAGTAITVTASDVALDLGGHTLSGDGSGTGIDVQGATNVSIQNGTVQGFYVGVVFGRSADCKLTDATVRQSSYLGIVGADTNGLTVTGCTATRNGVYGMWFGACRVVRVTQNSASGNSHGGIALDATSSNLSNNTASNNGCVGIDFFGASGNRVEGNTTDQNLCVGIALHNGSTGNTVTGNWATANGGPGISVDSGSTQNTVQNNTTTANNIGVAVGDGGTSSNTVQGNITTLNILGIWVGHGASSNTIQGNTALNNRDWDLEDQNPGCDANTWSGNTFGKANQPCAAGVPLPPPPP